MTRKTAMIGFGEAAQAFAPAIVARGPAAAFDRKTDDARSAPRQWELYREHGVQGCSAPADALSGAEGVLSLVTADQASAAASAGARRLDAGALWLDMNSVSPAAKCAAAAEVEGAGGRYVDVAIMAPVLPARAAVPMLASGPHAAAGAAFLASLGFTAVRCVGGPVGRAAAVKMVRSVVVKGMEALTAECVLAAARAGVLDEVLLSLDQSATARSWREIADYNLERLLVHGVRRAAEMDEVARTLDALGADASMTRMTARWQRGLGRGGPAAPPTLEAKVDAILSGGEDLAA